MAQANIVRDEAWVLWMAATEMKAEAEAAMLGAKDQFATQVRGERAATSRANKNRERQHTLGMKITKGSARKNNKHGTCSVECRASVFGGKTLPSLCRGDKGDEYVAGSERTSAL